MVMRYCSGGRLGGLLMDKTNDFRIKCFHFIFFQKTSCSFMSKYINYYTTTEFFSI